MVIDQNLRKAQLLELELLKKFKTICEKEGLNYYLLGGTAIGAVRHGGFIPWDDDIDVGLLREDYIKFMKCAHKYLPNNMKVLNWETDPTYSDYTMKLVDSSVSFFTERSSVVIEQNIWIDIFPLDGDPEAEIMKKIHHFKLKFYRMLLGFYYINEERVVEDRALYKELIYGVAKVLPFGKLVNPNRIKRRIDKELSKYSITSSKYIGNLMGAYHEREVFPKECFGVEGKKRVIKFEDDTFVVPYLLEDYLSHQYGDYMQLPPVEKQNPKHKVIKVVFKGET